MRVQKSEFTPHLHQIPLPKQAEDMVIPPKRYHKRKKVFRPLPQLLAIQKKLWDHRRRRASQSPRNAITILRLYLEIGPLFRDAAERYAIIKAKLAQASADGYYTQANGSRTNFCQQFTLDQITAC
jgi:hypothetical protein